MRQYNKANKMQITVGLTKAKKGYESGGNMRKACVF